MQRGLAHRGRGPGRDTGGFASGRCPGWPMRCRGLGCRSRLARHGAMFPGRMGLGQMLTYRLGVMQSMRCIQCRSGAYTRSEPDQSQRTCQNPRQSHPENILSTMDLVPCVHPGEAHFLLYRSRRTTGQLDPSQANSESMIRVQLMRREPCLKRSLTLWGPTSFYNNRLRGTENTLMTGHVHLQDLGPAPIQKSPAGKAGRRGKCPARHSPKTAAGA